MTYIAAGDLKTTLELTGTTFADDDIDRAVASAAAAIEEFTNRRTFTVPAGAATTRRFSALNPTMLRIDDATEVSSVKVDTNRDGTFNETWTEGAGDDYEVEPFNAANFDEPFTKITAIYKRFPRHRGAVQVTAKWGWPAVPAQVKDAQVMIASAILKRVREAPFGVAAFGMEGGTAMRILQNDPQIQDMLRPLQRDRVAVV